MASPSDANDPPPNDDRIDTATDGPPEDPTPNSPWWHATRVGDRFGDLLPFAVFPLVVTLFDTERIERTLEASSGRVSIGLEVLFPTPSLDLWSFADPPEPPTVDDVGGPHVGAGGGTTDTVSGPGVSTNEIERTTGRGTDLTVETPIETFAVPFEALGVTWIIALLGAMLLYGVVIAVLEAVYLCGLDRRLRNERLSIATCLRRYAPWLFLFTLVVFVAVLAFVPVLLIVPVLFLLAIPVILVFGYLFYAVPFLFVVDDARFLEAFVRSYGYAIDGGPYFRFALWHVLIGVGASVGLSILLSIGGAVGLVIALGISIPLSVWLTATTVSFVREFVELEVQTGSTA